MSQWFFDADDSLESMLKNRAVYDEKTIRIAHISDPHFVGCSRPTLTHRMCERFGIYGHEQDTWDAIQAVLEDGEAPDLLVISGDLTAFGTPASLRYARDRVLELARAWRVPPGRVFVVPGNHDRFLGYVGHAFRRLFPNFEDVFGDLFRAEVLDIGGRKVMIYPFDSTEEGFRLWPLFANTGRVRRGQFNHFNDHVKRIAQMSGAEVLIVILHHHPLPVPEVDVEGLTVMRNGGAFMAHMQKQSVDLVLHGHMHYSYSCRISYREDSPDTVVVAAGTACQGGKEACSITWIEFNPMRRAAVRVYTYGETGFDVNSNHGRTYRLDL